MFQDLAQSIDAFLAGVTPGEFILACLIIMVVGFVLYGIGSLGPGD